MAIFGSGVPVYRFHASFGSSVEERLRAIPGVYIARRGSPGAYVAEHGAWLVENELIQGDVAYTVAGPSTPEPLPWPTVEGLLRQYGEVRLGSFATIEAASTTSTPAQAISIFPFQREGVSFSAVRDGSLLLWPGGAGKTLGLTLRLLLTHPSERVLVVTRANARQQWAEEVRRFTTLEPYVIEPLLPKSKAKKPLSDDAYHQRYGVPKPKPPETLPEYLTRMAAQRMRPFVVCAWTSLSAHVATLEGTFRVIGFDEIHIGKQPRRQKARRGVDGEVEGYDPLTNLSASAAKLARSANVRVGTTATFISDRVRDAWSQIDIILPGSLGKTLTTFAFRHCAAQPSPWGAGLVTTGESNLDELAARLSFFAHIVPYEVSHASLAGMKRRESWYLSLSDCSKGWDGARIMAEMKAAAPRGASAVVEVQVAANAAMKHEPIAERLKSEIEANPKCKTLILDIRHENVDTMASALRKALPLVEVLAVHGGSTTPEQRERVRSYYMQHPGPLVLVATGASVGTSYNLHDTDLLMLAALPWTGGELHQWEKRVERLNAKRNMRVVFCIIRGTVDELFVAKVTSKLPAMEAVTGDSDTASAVEALRGIDDRDRMAREILALMQQVDADAIEDDHR